jgi:hypothetical protein
MKKLLLILGKILIGIFALIGLTVTAVFFAMQFGLLNVRGSIDDRNQFFIEAYEEVQQQAQAVANQAETKAGRIAKIVTTSNTTVNEASALLQDTCLDTSLPSCPWNETSEWAVIKSGLTKDAEILKRVESETGVSARLIASVVVPEQARFFSSNREVFKRWFEPMKLLGSLSQFSLGVSGIKQETAVRIEQYANDPTSPFYPGDGFNELLSYEPHENQADVLFNRLTDDKDHYYSYLYSALFIKQIQQQWVNAGFPIDNRAEILVTLFNLGFDKSKPNPTPSVGGANLSIGNTTYTYGSLGGLFYYSTELEDVLPRT